MAIESFDIYDEQGRPIGTATRREVHERGLWHHTFHCWLVRRGEGGRALILFQQRSETKDTNPGRLDITAAGHLSAGETVRDAAREMEEEIGWSVPFEQLVPYGTIREEGSGEAGGVPYIDREVSHVFGCLTAEPLEAFRLQQEEVAGLYEAGAEELIALMLGERSAVQASGVRLAPGGTLTAARLELAANDFVPRDRSYYVSVFRFLRELAARSKSGS
ncbi:NUDIX domain-containing protein [Cohnella lubricantis]|uniref:NUDIX domain-containing protein n=1 Tax=Cohnella lubricantis TaxID=2163172 RepID=A0A841TEH2_9BACL|nr:NUDIX domain-containing protein [Cohnella lubricantis]MBB6678656.1 NUDIX domain-containing protein [Cohnella lubricantis]MBP2119184.1 isopentenyldiphosphate isomerase [Cohnella lubricantis]